MRLIVFEGKTWEVYEALREKDKKMHRDLCRILKELQRSNLTQGIGKPEALRHQLSGFYSGRLSVKDRLIYRFDDENIYICAIGGHYQS